LKTWGYDEKRDMPGIESSWDALTDANMGFFDTAEAYGYGLSESIIGKQLARTSPEKRKDIVIATKWLPVPVVSGVFPLSLPITHKALNRQ